MKKNDDVLSDLEKDITGDWKVIRENVKQASKEMEIAEKEKEFEDLHSNPRRFFLPKFKQFYDAIIGIARDNNSHESFYHLQDLIRGIVYNHHSEHEKMPKSFNTIWEIFCDPSKYKCQTGIYCRNCKERYDVLYIESHKRDIGLTFDMRRMETFNVSTCDVKCPNCGRHFVRIMGADKIYGIFNHIHVNEYGGENDIRNKFRDNF